VRSFKGGEEKKNHFLSIFSTISFPLPYLFQPRCFLSSSSFSSITLFESSLLTRLFIKSLPTFLLSSSWREGTLTTNGRTDGRVELKEQQQLCVDLFFACCSLSSRDPREFRVTAQNLNTPHRMNERKKERKETTVPSLCRRLLVSPSLSLSFSCPSFPHTVTHSLNFQSVSRRWRLQPAAYILALSLSLRLSSFCLPVRTSVWTLVSPSRPLHSVDTNLIRLSLLLCLVQSSRLYSIFDDSCFNQQMCLFSSCCPLFLVDLPKLVYQVRQ